MDDNTQRESTSMIRQDNGNLGFTVRNLGGDSNIVYCSIHPLVLYNKEKNLHEMKYKMELQLNGKYIGGIYDSEQDAAKFAQDTCVKYFTDTLIKVSKIADIK